MTFRPIDDNDKGADEYFKKHFVFKERSHKEASDLLVDMYMDLSPKIIELMNRYSIANKEYIPFWMLARFLGLLMLKTLDNNVRTYPETERRPMMERSCEDIKEFIGNYMEGTDFSGPRADPKYFSDPSEEV